MDLLIKKILCQYLKFDTDLDFIFDTDLRVRGLVEL